jgi:non-heme Fe2+,alpha-ketoglutarate-dependent halogenase
MGKKLSQAQVAGFHEQGFLYPIAAFSSEQATTYLRKLQAAEAINAGVMGRSFNSKAHLLFKWADEIIRNSEVVDAIEDLLGPNIRVLHTTLWPKNPHDGTYVSWHQDGTYFGLEPATQVTAWVALSDAPIQAGCMEVVPGSHLLGELHHGELASSTNLLSKGQTIDVEFDQSRTEFMPLSAGQFSLHHTRLVHSSGPNRCDYRRVGFGIVYVSTDVRCTSSTRLSGTLVRGVDEYGHFDDEQPPQGDYGGAEQARAREAMARFKSSNEEQAARLTR